MNTNLTLKILLGTSLAIANILATKLVWVPYLKVAVPAGALAFGVAFLCSDLIVEREGKDAAHEVINASLVVLLVTLGLIYVTIWLPAAPFYEDSGAFETVLGSSASVTVASILTIAVTQHVDVRIFATIRQKTGAGHKWARNLISTGTSQALDTVMFIGLAFTVIPAIQGGDPMWGMPLLLTIVGQYGAKILIAGADTPFFYWLSPTQNDGEEVTA